MLLLQHNYICVFVHTSLLFIVYVLNSIIIIVFRNYDIEIIGYIRKAAHLNKNILRL